MRGMGATTSAVNDDLFDRVFDSRASCAENLKQATLSLLETPPRVETLVSLRRRHSDATTSVQRYSTALLWLASFNALRIIHQGSFALVGVEYLNALRAESVDLLAPTWGDRRGVLRTDEIAGGWERFKSCAKPSEPQ